MTLQSYNDIVATDTHDLSPWRDHDKQHRVLDIVFDLAPSRYYILGDMGEQFRSTSAWLESDILQREKLLAHHCDVYFVPGNWPHADRRYLRRLATRLHPIQIWQADYVDWHLPGRRVRGLHGHQFDKRLRRWLRWRWITPILPWIGRNILHHLPSELAMKNNNEGYMEAVCDIDQAAHKYAIKHGCDILMGHDHRNYKSAADDHIIYHLGAAGMRGHSALARITDEITLIPVD